MPLRALSVVIHEAKKKRGSRSEARIHAMKLPGWIVRLESGVAELRRAQRDGDLRAMLAGLDDVSFWIGRIMGEGISAAEASPEHEALFRRAVVAVVDARAAVAQARAVLQRDL